MMMLWLPGKVCQIGMKCFDDYVLTNLGSRIQWVDLLHSNIYHFHLLIRFIVSRVCRYIAYFLSDIHSLDNTTKDSVFVIKPRLRKIQDTFNNTAYRKTSIVNQCMGAATYLCCACRVDMFSNILEEN